MSEELFLVLEFKEEKLTFAIVERDKVDFLHKAIKDYQPTSGRC
jgi:hypothetical protein